MASDLDLADLHARQMNTLRRLRAAYDLNMLALRAAAPADREPRKELEQHLADAVNLMQGCVYAVNHAISNAEEAERARGVKEASPERAIVAELRRVAAVTGQPLGKLIADVNALAADGVDRAAGPVCGNCDTALPGGCGGQFKDDGAACALNRASGVNGATP